MCNIWKMKPTNELTMDEWKTMVRDPMFSNVRTLDITGGEATLAPDFSDKIKLFLDHMPKVNHVTMVSNGFSTTLILKRVEEIMKLLKPKNVSFNISISVDGTEKMHEAVRRIPKAFEKVKNTIFGLKQLSLTYPNLSVSVGSLIMHQNIDHVDEITTWLEDNDIKYGLQIVGFHDTYVRNLDTEASTDFSKADRVKLFTLLSKLAKPTSLRDVRSYYWRDLLAMYKDGKRRTTPCPFLHDQFAVDSFGSIYNCFSSAAIGNIRDGKSPSELYYSKKNIVRRERMWSTVCVKCNSGCSASEATAKDLKSYLYFRLTGKPYYGLKHLFLTKQ
jgi:MoaA/NifB/PqqE/SkfB family radical SAM enzyme